MSLLMLGTDPVLTASINRPLRGSWVADLEVDADKTPTGKLTIAGAGISLVGTVVQSQSWNDRQKARIVGGAGGMRQVLGPAWYRSVQLKTVLASILSGGGETLSTTSDAALLASNVAAWVRLRGTVGALLDQVLAVFAPSAIWRHLPDGTVWVGTPTWPTVKTTAVVQDNRGDEEAADLAGNDIALDAGVTTLGRKVGRVHHTVSVAGLRTEAWWYNDAGRGLQERLRQIVERFVGPRLDMRTPFIARVVTQNADGSLDVTPDSDRIPALTAVPIKYGVPGVSAKIRTGARVIIEFQDGDPRRPYASVWESASVLELDVNADLVKLAGGSLPVARRGDPVSVAVNFTQAKAIAALAVSPSPGPSIVVTGYILRGSDKVKSD